MYSIARQLTHHIFISFSFCPVSLNPGFLEKDPCEDDMLGR